MTAPRRARIADQIQRELAEVIRLELRDPRIGMVTLTGIEVSRDQSHAKIFFTVMGAESAAESAPGTMRASTRVGIGAACDRTTRTRPGRNAGLASRTNWPSGYKVPSISIELAIIGLLLCSRVWASWIGSSLRNTTPKARAPARFAIAGLVRFAHILIK